MRKIFTFLLVSFFALTSYGQMADGSIAPDFTMTDLNGVEHNLYTYLDSGYTVVIDFSATWCGPCWNYHTSGALEHLYQEHGPAGMSGVNENTTDDVMVFFIEGDKGSIDALNGGGSGTQGDWVAGTPYPIIPTVAPNNNQVTSDYEIGYWPTIYTICPDRLIQQSGTITAVAHYALALSDCPPMANNDNDARILNLDSPFGSYCLNTLMPEITIQNVGQVSLTTLDIVSYLDEVAIDTFFWNGELPQYSVETIELLELADLEYGEYVYEAVIMNPNGVVDEDPTNDSVASDVYLIEDGGTIVVRIKTDNYPGETSWDLKYEGKIIAMGGNYPTSSTYNTDVCVYNEECYTFTIYDSYGDGMPGGYAKVIYNDEVLVDITGSLVGSEKSEDFCLEYTQADGTDILTYKIEDEGVIDAEIHEIVVPLYLTKGGPVADFTLSDKAMAYIDDVVQISGETEVQIGDTMIYTVVAENGDEQDWLVRFEIFGSVSEVNNLYSVYPNPTNGVINIDGVEGASLEMFNALGEHILTVDVASSSEAIAMDIYNYGIYFVKIVKGNESNVVRFIYTE